MGQKPIAVDLFCGVGGMSLGFRAAGFEIAASVDFDPIHTATYRRNFPGTNVFTKSVADLKATDFKFPKGTQIDVVFGGPPCQGFSVIGKRDSKDERNRLLLEFARVATALSPKFILIENVEGMLLPGNQKTVANLFRRLRRSGYQVSEPRVLDAQNFGVPQRRRRVFIVAAKNGLRLPELQGTSTASITMVKDALAGLPKVARLKYLETSDIYIGKLEAKTAYAKFIDRELSFDGCNRKEIKSGLSGCMRTMHTTETIRRFSSTIQGGFDKVSRFRRLKLNGVSPTLRAGTGSSNGSFTAARPIHPREHRCITVREGARLHSYPDWFEFHPTKWHGFRQVGNSVPPLMAKAVAQSLFNHL